MHAFTYPISSFSSLLVLVCGLAACALSIPAEGAPRKAAPKAAPKAASARAMPPQGYKLVWSEEFKQPPGSPPNPALWKYDLGSSGFGNAELETYVRDMAHGQVVADKAATDGRAFRMRATSDGEGRYTSCRLKTAGKYAVQYGYIEGRIRLPRGQGIWPAFWMMGTDTDKVGWPDGGEIDIMESIGRELSTVYGTLHGPGYSGGGSLGRPFVLPKGKAFADAYHTFGILWKKDAITFTVDGAPYRTWTPADLPEGAKWVYNKPFYFIVNLAVGGRWPGYPDATTRFPQDYLIDYIRVYQPE